MDVNSHKPKVFIVVLNHNGGELLENCLKSLEKVTYQNFSVVVADNASKDGSLEMVRQNFPKAVIIENGKNIGFAAGNNIGIQYALARSADYVLLLNQDTEVEIDFLDKLIEAAERNPQVGILSPLIFWKKTEKIWFSGGKINWLTMKAVNKNSLCCDAPYETGFITGCSMLIRKEVFDEIGFLSEKYFLYWEDADFSYQAKKADFLNLVVPESRVYHFEKSGLASGKKLYWLVLSGLIFFKRNANFPMNVWIFFYTKLRIAKNILDRLVYSKDNNKLEVGKAYEDFKNGKY